MAKDVVFGANKTIEPHEITDNHLVISVDSNGKAKMKLHRVGDHPKEYAFVSLHNSTSWSAGGHSSIEKAVRASSSYGKIIVLDDLAELKNYL